MAATAGPAFRIGHGFDVHAFGPGDHVMLGGVRVPHTLGVVAQSDGDVILHALCDALLGALALGDIGAHFPPTATRWKNADSRELLRRRHCQRQGHDDRTPRIHRPGRGYRRSGSRAPGACDCVTTLPFAWGGPCARGRLREVPEDFEVEEIPGFEPSGEGEHHWLWIEKRGANTEWVARQLAAFASVQQVDVGFAGRKDRHALTRQAFTVRVPGRTRPDLDWTGFAPDGVRVLSHTRHARKLPRGALAGPRCCVRVRAVEGDIEGAIGRFTQIAAHGMPNYFGEQRFGRDGGNMAAASAMFAGQRVRRDQRNLLLSAARSAIFNAVLGTRVEDGTWRSGMEGEVWQLDGTGSIFGPEPVPMSDEILKRLTSGDIHPTGPLWGRGALRTAASAAALELGCAGAHGPLARGLEAADVAM